MSALAAISDPAEAEAHIARLREHVKDCGVLYSKLRLLGHHAEAEKAQKFLRNAERMLDCAESYQAMFPPLRRGDYGVGLTALYEYVRKTLACIGQNLKNKCGRSARILLVKCF